MLNKGEFIVKAALLSGGLALSTLFLPSCATTDLHAVPPVQSFRPMPSEIAVNERTADTVLKVMTLNVAHGRGNSFHQLLQRSATTVSNLDTIAALLRHQNPDVVALQEVDGPSFWSGDFSHVDYLANRGSFSRSVHGAHVDALGLSYGTALIAKLDLQNPEAVTFNPALSPVPKGFVVSTARWPGKPCMEFDLVSIHLDFASESTRRKQARELIETLRARNRPMIVMGDFNTEWQQKNSTLHAIAQELSLHAYRPERTGLDTFPALGERLDWILISPHFRFQGYRVIPDTVSDHRGVIAELALSREPATRIAANRCHGPTISSKRRGQANFAG